MSLALHLLNPYLRYTEKPHLLRATLQDTRHIRDSFETKAKLLFHAPRGTKIKPDHLLGGGRSLSAVSINRDVMPGPLLLYFHGGGYIFGSPRTHRAMLAKLSQLSACPAVLPKYRLAPEHPFPAAPEDALCAYHAVKDHPGGVILGGDSAGGGLALSLLGEITRQGLPQPLGTFAFSPLTDLSFSSASVRDNDPHDVVLPGSRTAEFAEAYLQGADPANPRGSPLHADFTGASPVWLAVADREILLDDSTRMATRLRAQGVPVTFELEHNLPHVWPIFHNTLPEARTTLKRLAAWIKSL